MKKKIAIIGSTGSIGKTLLETININKNNFEVILLSANKDYKTLLGQAEKYNVKNLIIKDKRSYFKLKKKNKKNINIFNSYDEFDLIFKKKIDYVMSSITGIDGLEPTLKIIKFTKKIAIANKESIICGWNLISKELKKNKVEFIPVDSEHFSIWYGLLGKNKFEIEKIYITASGGPFYNTPLSKLKKISISQALKHPNWKMGKKISIDSATMINKVYEVIEARKIFKISYDKIEILTHPKSYVHAIIKFSNGLIKMILHDTTMKIPIFNTLFINSKKKILTKSLNIDVLNNLNLKTIKKNKFPMVRLLNYLNNKNSLYETVIVSANDVLVELFLQKKIKFLDIQKKLFAVIRMKEFVKYKSIQPRNYQDVIKLSNYVRLKIFEKVYKSQNVNS